MPSFDVLANICFFFQVSDPSYKCWGFSEKRRLYFFRHSGAFHDVTVQEIWNKGTCAMLLLENYLSLSFMYARCFFDSVLQICNKYIPVSCIVVDIGTLSALFSNTYIWKLSQCVGNRQFTAPRHCFYDCSFRRYEASVDGQKNSRHTLKIKLNSYFIFKLLRNNTDVRLKSLHFFTNLTLMH